VAAYTYEAQRQDELSVTKGSEVSVMEKHADGWWLISATSGVGLVPGNYFAEVDDTIGGLTAVTSIVDVNGTLLNSTMEVSLPGFLLLNQRADLRVEAKLGKGGSGDIYRGTLLNPDLTRKNENHSAVAVKMIKRVPGISPENELAIFHQEVSIMWSVSFHENVISMLGYCEGPNMIVTELLDTDLMDYVQNQPQQITPPVACRILFHISRAMVEIHRIGIIHRDLKCANILLEGVASPARLRAKICDFGIARNASRPKIINQKIVSIAGFSLLYTSPETFARLVVKNLNPDPEDEKKADVYSWAIIVYEVMFRTRAWNGERPEDIERLVRSGKRPRCSKADVERDKYLNPVCDPLLFPHARWL